MGILAETMDEVATALELAVPPTITVSARPVNRVTAPAMVVTLGEPFETTGGTHCHYEIGLSVVLIAGRFDTPAAFDTLDQLNELARNALEKLEGCVLEPAGRAGPVEAAGVDYLAAVRDLTMYRN